MIIEEGKHYLLKIPKENKLDILKEGILEIKVEKLAMTGKFAKIVVLYTDQKPISFWTVTSYIKPLVIDTINYPIGV